MKYRLRKPVVAVFPDDEHGLRILTIRSGATLTIVGDPVEANGMVEAEWRSIRVSVFLRDVTTNGELLKDTSVG